MKFPTVVCCRCSPSQKKLLTEGVKRCKKDTKFFNLCKKNKLIIEVLLETIKMIPCENTGILKKVISRIYKISK